MLAKFQPPGMNVENVLRFAKNTYWFFTVFNQCFNYPFHLILRLLVLYLTLYLETKKGKCFYARCVGVAKNVAYPLNSPSSQAIKSHPVKARSYEPKPQNETMLPVKKEKSHHFTLPTQDTTNSHPIYY